jgi:AcrR family transcriptional regulator
MVAKQALTGASARRERGRQEMRAAILTAAASIFEADGIDGLTIRAVAQAIGYSPGAIYEYFDSKEAILTAIYFEGTDGLGGFCERSVATMPPNASAVDAIIALGHAYRTYALAHPDLYRLVFGGFKTPPSAPPGECQDGDADANGFDVLADITARGVASGELVDIPPPVIAINAWAAVHGFVSLEITGHLTGGDAPGEPPPSPEEGEQRRAALFEAQLRMVLLGIVKEEHRQPLGST